MFSIQLINKDISQKFFDNFQGDKTFLQNVKYATLREKLKDEVLYYGFFANKNLVGIANIFFIQAKRGTFLHLPHGPLINSEYEIKGMKFFLEEYKKIGKTKKCDFVRIAPLLPIEKKSQIQEADFKPAPYFQTNPVQTIVLDLTKPEEEILAQMKKSTRYEIRRIEKSGIKTKMGNSQEDLNIFWQLHLETVSRQGFVPFSKKSTELEMQIFDQDCQIFSASIDDQYLASSVILFDQHSGYYHQGASIKHKMPVSYATLWSAILESKKRGCTEFNFWGVCAENEINHPWSGLSTFKRKFGGTERKYVHAQDFPLTKKYLLNFAVEKYRKWKRKY